MLQIPAHKKMNVKINPRARLRSTLDSNYRIFPYWSKITDYELFSDLETTVELHITSREKLTRLKYAIDNAIRLSVTTPIQRSALKNIRTLLTNVPKNMDEYSQNQASTMIWDIPKSGFELMNKLIKYDWSLSDT